MKMRLPIIQNIICIQIKNKVIMALFLNLFKNFGNFYLKTSIKYKIFKIKFIFIFKKY